MSMFLKNIASVGKKHDVLHDISGFKKLIKSYYKSQSIQIEIYSGIALILWLSIFNNLNIFSHLENMLDF